MTTRGFCLCQKTTWEFEGEISWACYCHWDDCRRNCAAPVVAWLGIPARWLTWTGQSPKSFSSSKGVTRYCCEACGSPLAFEAEHYPDEIHLYAASLEKPELFKPAFHVNYGSKLPWLEMNDNLPKHENSLLHMPDYSA